MDNLVDFQRSIEEAMIDEAVVRQNNENQRSYKRGEQANSKLGRTYVKKFAKLFVPAIESFLTPTPGAGRMKVAAKLLKNTGLSPKVLSILSVKGIVNTLAFFSNKHNVGSRVTLCMHVAELIHDEWRIQFFASDANRKKLLKKLMKDFDKRAYPREWRKRTIRNYFEAEQISWEGWDKKQRLHVGYALVTLFNQTTGLLVQSANGTKFEPSEELVAAVAETTKRQTNYFTLYRPMVVPPYDWSTANLFRGGYIS